MENRLPELRFPEFSGEWNKVLLDDFAKRGSGHTPSKSHPEYYNGEINWISLSDSKKLDNGFIEETNTKITPLGIKNSSAVLHEAGSVLLSRDAGVGKSAVMKHSMAVSQHFIVWTAKSGISSNWFLYNILQILKPEFERIAIGNTIKTIGLPYFKKLQITVPSFPEQDKIANFLTEVDKKLTALKQKKSLLEQYKKGVMQQIFSQELRFKNDNGNDFADWEEKKLGEVADIIMGQSPDSNSYNSNGIGLPLIQGNADIENRKTNPRNHTSQVTKKCDIGDLILTVRAPVGAVAKSIHDACIGRGVCSIKNKLNSNIEFIFQFLLDYEVKWGSLEQGSTFTAVSGIEIKKIKINLPSFQEQTKIANFLWAIDEKIKDCQEQIEKTELWKKGLLQQLFV